MNLYELIMSGLVLDQSCGSSDTDLMSSKQVFDRNHAIICHHMPSYAIAGIAGIATARNVKNSISPLQALKDHLSAVKYFRYGGCIENALNMCKFHVDERLKHLRRT